MTELTFEEWQHQYLITNELPTCDMPTDISITWNIDMYDEVQRVLQQEYERYLDNFKKEVN